MDSDRARLAGFAEPMSVETSSDPFRPNTCPDCRRSVIWAKLGPRFVAIETCADGAGDLALVQPLFSPPGEMMEAQPVGNGTRYRQHRGHCPKGGGPSPAGGAFSGGSFTRKKRGPA